MPKICALDAVLEDFDEGRVRSLVAGWRLDTGQQKSEVPVHAHRLGQLVFALTGGVTCEAPDAIWMVPPQRAVWIPSQTLHSVRATANARLCYLFIQPGAARLPDRCCTLAITPLVRELVLDMAAQSWDYELGGPLGRKALVLLDELSRMPVENLHVPTSSDPRMQRIARLLSEDPSDRRTMADWGRLVAMSERSLARLVQRETGLPFGRWRQQLHLVAATRQLCAGESVQRVSEHLGYESVTAFITMFKKALGKPPGRYFAELQDRA
ncbi:helix-turn-helix transcriptional regulator [Roseateles sp. DAIF2]|uniref:AraC family transcriptional regulator n=1 Tax=Roseateles sp. DAIF2 TaxID=2714952 RepID=UPI0018A2BC9B|nr:helix-turn-helix transcriptional regulator [Roseateles sp. DAIF2]QPF74966.1 helix-turn-helix transcriptional regulator [Roseateles sp. DAIF2]